MYYFKPHEDGVVSELFQPNDPAKFIEDGFLTVEEIPTMIEVPAEHHAVLKYVDEQLVWVAVENPTK